MSAAPAAYQESLSERLHRGRLQVAEVLRYATEIATCLRDLHAQGLVYGAVSSQLILIGPAGATLRSNGLARLGDGRCDVSGLGGVLSEMLRHVEGSEDLQIEIGHLAEHCQADGPDMQKVLIILRLLGLRARQSALLARRSVVARRQEALTRHWMPLALVVLALWGK